ncbi:TetR/AcrR family transcriptional regulator [Allorhizocola rhizosphaerae]|uniref:TetR/AcrR family transcriptional regulator n=1 Tax=Allorhizocola rhizosphaerae TaxID=1872709 RepID=UPI000E3E5CF4|nr:TetR/AcrR family transcriptional regulator [Allorhizocola rhizosphaerae]
MPAREVGVLPPERRRLLLQTALAEFADVGYEGASLNRIIGARHMSKSSFYHYFASKEALFEAVVTDIGGAFVAELAPPGDDELAEGDFWGHIMRLAERLAELSSGDPGFMRLAKLFYLPDVPRNPGSPLAKAAARIDDWIDRALTIGRAGGAVGDDLPIELQRRLLRAVLWAMDEWSVANASNLDHDEIRRLSTAQFEAIRRLLAPGITPLR